MACLFIFILNLFYQFEYDQGHGSHENNVWPFRTYTTYHNFLVAFHWTTYHMSMLLFNSIDLYLWGALMLCTVKFLTSTCKLSKKSNYNIFLWKETIT